MGAAARTECQRSRGGRASAHDRSRRMIVANASGPRSTLGTIAARAAPVLVALVLAACAQARPAAGTGRGRLVVLVVVDQLRYADLLLLAPEFGPDGFAGLGQPLPLRYVSAATETASGHATLATGAWADEHGIVGNLLFDGVRARPAVEDVRCPIWGRGDQGKSAASLLVPTVGDELKLTSLGRSKVVSVSGKDRAALLLAGTSADLALWFDTDSGQLTSTICYTPAPPDWVVAARRDFAVSQWSTWQWTPSRPMELLQRYGAIEAPGAVPAYGLGPRFPHAVGQGDSSVRFHKAVRASPPGNEITLGAASLAVEALQLGQRGEADLLLVSLSAVDLTGHAFGPHSVERVDALLRAHDGLVRFLGGLRGKLGSRLSVVLASDHGVPPLGAQAAASRTQGGAVSEPVLSARIDAALRAAFGPAPDGSWVLYFDDPWIGLQRRPDVDPLGAARVAAGVLRREPGIARVYTSVELAAEPPDSPARHAWSPGRSGDLLVIARPGWNFPPEGDAVEHRAQWNESALVPMLVQAQGFELRPALRGATLRATQVAPTLARLLGIAPPAGALDEAAVVETNR